MKLCSKCNLLLPLSEYNKRYETTQAWCRECNRANARRWYSENREEHIKTITARNKERVSQNRIFVREYLSAHPCVDCGEKDIVVLEFDHVRGEKRGNLSTMSAQGFSTKILALEIEKCEVVCANDHRRRTTSRRAIRSIVRSIRTDGIGE